MVKGLAAQKACDACGFLMSAAHPVIKLVQTMELGLNIAWLLLCMTLMALWMRYARRRHQCSGPNRGMQLMALAIVLLLLFPVISVSDDLLMAHNPAETDTCVQKSCNCGHHHQHMPAMASLPAQPVMIESSEYAAVIQLSELLDRSTQNPALRRVENRPPPAAL